MRKNIKRILIETTIRKTIQDIKLSPEKSIRNLVNKALTYSKGRSGQRFFGTAQEMLLNEKSAYYDLIKDTIHYVDTDKLVNFGMNIGYNSCTVGAKTIRELNDTEQFQIPWNLSLTIDYDTFSHSKNHYRTLIAQGMELGIYTWILYSTRIPQGLLSLISEYSDCAFILFCSGENITDELLQEANALNNLMFAIEYDSHIQTACETLRHGSFLYSVCFPYTEEDAERIMNENFLSYIVRLHPIITFFQANVTCSSETREKVYQFIKDTRTQQVYSTVLMDLILDNQFSNRSLSLDSSVVGFDASGQFYSISGKTFDRECNLYQNNLKTILKLALPIS